MNAVVKCLKAGELRNLRNLQTNGKSPQGIYFSYVINASRSQWPRGLRRRSAAAHLLRSWVRIPPGAWIFVCCECCVLSGRGLCDELITRPEESYRLWCVVVCELETSKMRRPWPALGRSVTLKKNSVIMLYVRRLLCGYLRVYVSWTLCDPNPCIIGICVWQYYQQMHTSIIKLIYILNDLLHVSARHLALYKEVKYKWRIP